MVRSTLLIVVAAVVSAVVASPLQQLDPRWKWPKCTNETMKTRYDFDKLKPAARKEFTDAVKCLMDQPSQLDQNIYPGAINRFFDYAAIHINLTQSVHLDGFFLTWHRMFLHIFETDLINLCGFNGTLPYWNWPATADNLTGSHIFSGDEYSMSGDGLYVDNGPVVLSPNFSLPHGSGGGCVTTGPFAYMNYTMQPIGIQLLLQGGTLPPNAFAKNETCLTRDLNTFVAKSQTNWTQVAAAIAAPNQTYFTELLNGVLGGSSLGLHSGAHFVVGNPASSIFVSPQDPIWYPLHAMLDNVYVQWQKAHPKIYDQLYGTETANNVPPSANVTLDTWEPDWGYLSPTRRISELISTTAGPFCYQYDWELESA